MAISRQSSGINHVGVAGAGAWGTALAQAAANAGCRVTVLASAASQVQQINQDHENKRFLPGIHLSDRIVFTHDASELGDAHTVLLVCPAQQLRRLLGELSFQAPVLICSKGIERESGKLMPEVAQEMCAGMNFGMLSGPSFALDVARRLPCAITLAMNDAALATTLSTMIGTPAFRPYVSTDVIGVAVGGAVKNVLAIACGIVEGRGFGESARAALTTRGFAEMTRFGLALGGKIETMGGLSGLGDLILTASSKQSRNFSLGVRLAGGGNVGNDGPLAEGAASAEALVKRAQAIGIQMPIAEAVADIVAGRVEVDAAIQGLLSRPFKSEH